MKVTLKGSWRQVADAARTTIGLEEGTKEPSNHWKKTILLAEHSPIRKLVFNWKWTNIPYWSSVHFVRHKIGIEHWVKTQRSDRTGVDRNQLPQGALVSHECEANAQAIITISRKRLCMQASPETRQAWKSVVEGLKEVCPELRDVCVPECIYRGGYCPEFKSCGWINSDEAKTVLEKYRN